MEAISAEEKMSVVNEFADVLESKIEDFLKVNINGGKFILPCVDGLELAIPLMILTFELQGWEVIYDFHQETDWLEFNKPKLCLLTYDGGE